MCARELFGKRDANRAHGDMDGASLQPCKDALHAEHHAFHRGVVGKHCDDHLAPRSLTSRLGEGVSGLEQVGRHAAAHVAKPDESDLHDLQLLMTPI
jgi:hypothetical protein